MVCISEDGEDDEVLSSIECSFMIGTKEGDSEELKPDDWTF